MRKLVVFSQANAWPKFDDVKPIYKYMLIFKSVLPFMSHHLETMSVSYFQLLSLLIINGTVQIDRQISPF